MLYGLSIFYPSSNAFSTGCSELTETPFTWSLMGGRGALTLVSWLNLAVNWLDHSERECRLRLGLREEDQMVMMSSWRIMEKPQDYKQRTNTRNTRCTLAVDHFRIPSQCPVQYASRQCCLLVQPHARCCPQRYNPIRTREMKTNQLHSGTVENDLSPNWSELNPFAPPPRLLVPASTLY